MRLDFWNELACWLGKSVNLDLRFEDSRSQEIPRASMQLRPRHCHGPTVQHAGGRERFVSVCPENASQFKLE